MDIVARNLFRLLRNGAFGTQELMEPMSAYKWERLYQLALVHRVVNYAYQGLQNSRDQFFVNLPEKQKEAWLKAVGDTSKQMPAMEDEEDELLRADQFTNPVINHQLQNILDDEHSDTNTRQMLLMIIRVVRHILNEGMPICQLLELGIFMRQQGAEPTGRRTAYTTIRLSARRCAFLFRETRQKSGADRRGTVGLYQHPLARLVFLARR